MKKSLLLGVLSAVTLSVIGGVTIATKKKVTNADDTLYKIEFTKECITNLEYDAGFEYFDLEGLTQVYYEMFTISDVFVVSYDYSNNQTQTIGGEHMFTLTNGTGWEGYAFIQMDFVVSGSAKVQSVSLEGKIDGKDSVTYKDGDSGITITDEGQTCKFNPNFETYVEVDKIIINYTC